LISADTSKPITFQPKPKGKKLPNLTLCLLWRVMEINKRRKKITAMLKADTNGNEKNSNFSFVTAN
jgi:hypothetical protein